MEDPEGPTMGESVIYIGQKPVMNYVLAAGKKLAEPGASILVQARGKCISKAVDVALITLDRSKDSVKLGGISISTEVLPGPDGAPQNISSIKIALNRP
jgi:DNA-binding protein